LAVIVIGGLISSTALNMIVLPTVYVWRERRKEAANGR
jgi:heavy metal efflux system protein